METGEFMCVIRFNLNPEDVSAPSEYELPGQLHSTTLFVL